MLHDDDGPAARRIDDEADIRDVIELLRLNYLRVMRKSESVTSSRQAE